MAIHNLRINRVEYDDVANTVTLVMFGDSPAPPTGVREDLWYPAPASFTVIAPVKKGAFTQAAGIYVDETTQQRYKITYTGSGWTNPVPVDANGNEEKR